ncbi:hypothetical protein [Acidovorax sp. JHL-9]|uniref:hypothetical protein n=1 Tax=Acidovorax sp. JHL-9 TaxID=1276756 RepID=UPI0012DC7D27|nr:hypothetical protein [Acidovorax sp. JHL-9]
MPTRWTPAPVSQARALESNDASAIRKRYKTHQTDLEEAKRALLRVLSDLVVERAAA